MTLKDIIDDYKAKNLSIPYTDDQLTAYVTTLDNMVQVELLNTYPYIYTADSNGNVIKTSGTLVAYNWVTDQSTEVKLSGTPFEDIYAHYIASMVQFEKNDWLRYSNLRAMFNARYMEAVFYYSRTSRPPTNQIKNYW